MYCALILEGTLVRTKECLDLTWHCHGVACMRGRSVVRLSVTFPPFLLQAIASRHLQTDAPWYTIYLILMNLFFYIVKKTYFSIPYFPKCLSLVVHFLPLVWLWTKYTYHVSPEWPNAWGAQLLRVFCASSDQIV